MSKKKLKGLIARRILLVMVLIPLVIMLVPVGINGFVESGIDFATNQKFVAILKLIASIASGLVFVWLTYICTRTILLICMEVCILKRNKKKYFYFREILEEKC